MRESKKSELLDKPSRSKALASAGLPENERGLVLVLALMLLALLTILGAWAVGTSSTDLKIAGNFRNTQNAFYSADAALAYAAAPVTLTTAYLHTLATGSTAVWSQVISIGTVTANIQVMYLGSGPLPADSKYYGDLDVNGNPKFHGLFFVLNTEGNDANKAAVAVEAAVVQVVGEDAVVSCSSGTCAWTATAGEQVHPLYWRQR